MNCEDLDRCLLDTPVLRSESALPNEAATHVAACARCARAVEDRLRLERVLDRDRQIEPREGFAELVMRRIDEPVVPRGAPVRSGSRFHRRWAAAGLVAAAAIVLLVSRYRTTVTPSDAEPDAAMLAKLDLFLNWDLLDEHAEDLDVITADDLDSAAKDPEEG